MHFYIETISKERKKDLNKGRLTNFKKERLEVFSYSILGQLISRFR